MSDHPRLATLDDDGWSLQDAEARYAHGTGVYWLPARAERDRLAIYLPEGVLAKLIFVIRYSKPAGGMAVERERMWVELLKCTGALYFGQLANQPKTETRAVQEKMPVWFRAEHIIDFMVAEQKPASHGKDVVHCERHGPSDACYVCEHLAGGSGLGFNPADDAERRRPHAWCNDCERLVRRAGSWENVGEDEPTVQLLCGGCYDECRARNETRHT